MTFWEKYQKIIKKNNSYLCVGLDSDYNKLPQHLKELPDPIFSFNKAIIDATKDIVACYKPNFAFYLSRGLESLTSLQKTIDYIPQEIPVILDIKAGDIGNTMSNYAKSFFKDWQCSAITANPLMGGDVCRALEAFTDNFAFMLALTSNPTATDYLKHNFLYKKIAEDIAKLPYQQFGAVVGATNSAELQELRTLMPKSLFLVPGIGAQGGSLREVIENTAYSKADARLLINSSRGIIFADSTKDFAQKARQEALKLQSEINSLLAEI